MAEYTYQYAATPTSYYDNRFERQAVKILPGEYYATRNNTMIVTVLGSCVSVCLRDAKNGVAGMNHFLLPSDHHREPQEYGSAARYGMFAMELLINEMQKMGAERRYLQAKIFGGGNVLKGLTVNNIGELNADFIVQYLIAEHIPVLASDLLGIYPRKVYFLPENGQVLVKKIKKLNNSTIMDRESIYRMRLREEKQPTDVDIFE